MMYIAFIIGLVLIVLAIRLNNKRKWLAKNGIRIQGVIVGQAEGEMNGRDLFFPIVQFNDPVLGKRELQLSEGTNMKRNVGSKIELVHPPNDPENIQEYSTTMTMGHLVLLIVGLFFALFGFGLITVSLLWEYFIEG